MTEPVQDVQDVQESRTERRDRRGRAILDGWMIAGAIAVVVCLTLGAWALSRGGGGSGAGRTLSKTAAAGASDIGSSRADEASPAASGVFARMRGYGVELHFPASPKEMVGIGFHQAWNTKATDLVPTLKVHPRDEYADTRAALSADHALKLFLMMARGRGSSEYSAADCAVTRDATILSPVTGVVTLVKTYKLSGVGTDYHVEIEADGANAVRVVLIHIRDVKVKAGTRVVGGVTPIATVRHLAIDSQVNRYLPVDAEHTHVQINAVGYKLNEGT